MPIYEYVCKSCGHGLESLQSMSENPLTDCPECGKPELKRKISAAGFRLKGGGWYETDFKKGNRRNVHGDGEKKSAGESGSKESGSGESKSKESGSSGSSKGDRKAASSD